MKIYVASLSDYNAGILHGAWFAIDETSDADELHAQIGALLAQSPTARREGNPAEEWAIHDYDDWPVNFGEGESLETLIAFANLYAEIACDSRREAFATYLRKIVDTTEAGKNWAAAFEEFEDQYHGEWPSRESYAEDYVTETTSGQKWPDLIGNNIDWSGVYDDLGLTDYPSTHGYHIFSS